MTTFDNLLTHGLMAATKGMEVVREAQLLGTGAVNLKEDETFLSAVDRESEAVILSILRDIPGTRIFSEEAGFLGEDSENLVWLVDPLDGTKSCANGLGTSTVIVAIYNIAKKEIVLCIIGDPACSRVWTATSKQKTWSVGQPRRTLGRKNVWVGELSRNTTVYVDTVHGFVRGNKQILSDEQTSQFLCELSKKTGIFMAGSNGMHQALVANGGENVAGVVTLALGGPWDVAGVLLVFQAGGYARAFELINGQLVEQNPLDAFSYDILISGNTKKTVDELFELLYAVVCNH